MPALALHGVPVAACKTTHCQLFDPQAAGLCSNTCVTVLCTLDLHNPLDMIVEGKPHV